MVLRIKTACFEGEIFLVVLHSVKVAWCLDPVTGYPIFTATACLEREPADGCVWLKGWDENEGLPEALEAAGAVELTGRTEPLGCHQAQEARLLEKIYE